MPMFVKVDGAIKAMTEGGKGEWVAELTNGQIRDAVLAYARTPFRANWDAIADRDLKGELEKAAGGGIKRVVYEVAKARAIELGFLSKREGYGRHKAGIVTVGDGVWDEAQSLAKADEQVKGQKAYEEGMKSVPGSTTPADLNPLMSCPKCHKTVLGNPAPGLYRCAGCSTLVEVKSR